MTLPPIIRNLSPFAMAMGRKLSLAGLARPVMLAAMLLATTLLTGGGAVQAEEAEPIPVVQTVNINKADAVTLAAALNGVGQARAEEIIRYREAYGPFKSVEELVDVKGIGPATLEKNRAVITLE